MAFFYDTQTVSFKFFFSQRPMTLELELELLGIVTIILSRSDCTETGSAVIQPKHLIQQTIMNKEEKKGLMEERIYTRMDESNQVTKEGRKEGKHLV